MNARRIDFAVFVGVAWLLVLSYLCLAPLSGPSLELPFADKLGHIGFFFLGGLCIGILPLRPIQFLLAIFLLTAAGALIEVLQSLTAFRQAEWADLLADGVGAAAGVYCAMKASLWLRMQPA